MPEIISLGPLILATERFLAVVLIALFLSVSKFLTQFAGPECDRIGILGLVAGLLGARLGFVAQHWSAFAAEPLTILAFWQGGFSLTAGLAAAILMFLIGGRKNLPGSGFLSVASLLLAASYLLLVSLIERPERSLAPTITLMRLDGRGVTTGSLRGRPVVINLWATWCPPCRREMPMMIEEAKRSSVPIVLINQGEEAKTVHAFLQRENLDPSPVLLNPTGSISEDMSSAALPTTLFVDPGGRVISVHSGEISRATLQSEISQLEKSKMRPPL